MREEVSKFINVLLHATIFREINFGEIMVSQRCAIFSLQKYLDLLPKSNHDNKCDNARSTPKIEIHSSSEEESHDSSLPNIPGYLQPCNDDIQDVNVSDESMPSTPVNVPILTEDDDRAFPEEAFKDHDKSENRYVRRVSKMN